MHLPHGFLAKGTGTVGRHSWPTVIALLRDELRLAASFACVRARVCARSHSLVNIGVNAFTGTDGANWPQLRIELPCINSRKWPLSACV